MSPSDLFIEVVGLALRFLPWKAPTGLVAVGRPGRDAPVLLTGNYRLTLSRVRRALKGRDLWLLAADSRGINVWCAAGGGHLTNSDVISLLQSSGIAERVDHRRLILPQLTATGLQPRIIEEHSGWQAVFGPVLARHLPAYLERGRITGDMRTIGFPPAHRLEIGAYWGIPMGMVMLAAGWPLFGIYPTAICAAAAFVVVVGVSLLLPWIPIIGWKRLWTALGAAVAFIFITGGIWSLSHGISGGALAMFAVVGLVVSGILTADLAGTTPVCGSGLFHTGRYHIELVADRCSGAAMCILVCPRSVLEMHERRVHLARPGNCIRCGACIVQCPEDALLFRIMDGSAIEASTIRNRKLDLLGRRTVTIPDL